MGLLILPVLLGLLGCWIPAVLAGRKFLAAAKRKLPALSALVAGVGVAGAAPLVVYFWLHRGETVYWISALFVLTCLHGAAAVAGGMSWAHYATTQRQPGWLLAAASGIGSAGAFPVVWLTCVEPVRRWAGVTLSN